jgi:ribosome-associated translation inhibitor RaiA
VQVPIVVNLAEVENAPELERHIRQRIQKLERFSSDLLKCQVWLEAPEGHHRKGRLFRVRIRLTLPGEEILVEDQPASEDGRAAIRGSFDAARRQLEDFVRRRRGQVKTRRQTSAAGARKKGGE